MRVFSTAGPSRPFLLSLIVLFLGVSLLAGCGGSSSLNPSGSNTANVTLSPALLTWGSQPVGQTSTTQSFTVKNVQSVPLVFSSITASTGSDFAVTSTTCPTNFMPLAAGASCTVTVSFTPTDVGTRTGSVTVVDNAPTGGTESVMLTGTGTASSVAVTLAPTSLTFSDVEIGATSAAQTATLANNTKTAITFTGFTLDGPFAQKNTCAATLAAGASCSFAVTYMPTSAAAAASSLIVSFTGESADSAATVQVALSGTSPATGPGSGVLSLSPTSNSFGSVAQGATGASSTFTLTNGEAAAITLSSIKTGVADFTESSNCPASPAKFAAGASCTITVSFDPTTTGARSGTLTVTDGAGETATAALTGTGLTAAGLTFSPTTLSWGSVMVGQTSGAKTVTVTNNTAAAVTLSSISVPAGSDYLESATTCSTTASLVVGASCTISVEFRPTAAGVRTGTITVTDNAATPSQMIPLSGTGTVGALLFSPTNVVFTGTLVGNTSASQVVTLTNKLTTTLTLSSIKIGNSQFTQTDTCGSTLAAGANCALILSYTPTSLKAATSTLTVAYTGASNGSIQLYLSGTPAASYLTLTPPSYNFRNVTTGGSGAQTNFILTNTDTAAVTLSSIATGTAAYTETSGCPVAPATLAAGGTCTITVTFLPTTTGTTLNDTLTVTPSGSIAPATASLTGLGVLPIGGNLTFSTSTLSFDPTQVGQMSNVENITVTNPSALRVQFTSILAGSDFNILATSCPSGTLTLAPMSSCTVSVDFEPLSVGQRSSAVTFTDSATGSPQQVALNGTGVTGPILFSPTKLIFPGTTAAGSTSATETATITNTLSTAVAITSIAATTQFAETNDCGSSLAANATCTVTVSFKPSSLGAKTGTVAVKYASGTSYLFLSANSTGPIPTTLTLLPKTYTFSTAAGNMDQAIGTTSAPAPITLYNGLKTAVSISSIAIGAPFSVSSNDCGSSLAAGAMCTINLVYSPTTIGFQSATLTVTNSGTTSPLTAAISGNAVAGVSVSPSSGGLAFFTQIVQTTSSPQPVLLTNNLTTPLTISAITSSANFPITTGCISGTGPGTLAAGSSCAIEVSFDPQTTGAITGTLSITESASTTPLTVPLSGTGILGGVGASITVTPNAPCVLPSGTQQFTATTNDLASSAVLWYVNGVLGGNSSVGIIDSTGLYTAPSTAGTRTIKAVSQSSTSISGSTTLSITTAPLFVIYPYSASVPVSGDQTFQAQVCTQPDSRPVTYTVDGVAGGNAKTGTITSEGVYTAPGLAGTHHVAVTDAAISKTTASLVTVYSNIAIDFGSRTKTTYPVAADIFGAGRGESFQSTADRELLTDAGVTVSRLSAQIPQVYAKGLASPDWTKIDPLMTEIQAAGQHAMLQMFQSPVFLQPTTGTACIGSADAAPSSNAQWAQIAQTYVMHMDQYFPGVVTDYEIWNEPNASGMCSPKGSNINNYMALYAAAAPLMKAQAKTDGQTIRVGGPVLSGYDPSWITSLTTNAATAPYVDFISYHNYMFGPSDLEVQWDTYNGQTSLYQQTTTEVAETYNHVYTVAKAGDQPSGVNVPIYITEFNTNYSFDKDCCRNDPTYAPVWNALYVTDVLNSTYTYGVPAPSKLIYFAGSAYPYFCLIGTIDTNMDCAYSRDSTPEPYPQYYAFQLMGSSNYLGLQDGGYLAPTVTPPTGGGGLTVAAFYTSATNSSQDSILITNPTGNAVNNVPIAITNTGLTSPSATLYEIVNGSSITSSALALTPTASGYSATVSVPAYTVMGISLKGH